MVLVWLLGLAWASKAEQLMYAGDVAGALEAAEAEASTAPEDIDAQERYIDLLLNLYLVDRAVELAEKRVEQKPTDPDSHYLLGRALPDPQGATRAYERALKLDPLHARSHMGMGAIHTALGDHRRAAASYGRALRSEESLAEAWLGLSRAHIALEQIDEAIGVSEKAIEAVPGHPDAYLTLAVLDPGRAGEVLARAVENAGQDARVHAAYADHLLGAGKARKALASANKALAIDPSEGVALRVAHFAGEIVGGKLSLEGYRKLVKAREANQVDEHDALVAAFPKSAAARLARSRALRAAGKDEAALQDLEAARAMAPNEPEVLGQLGLLYLDLNRPAEAIAPLDAARDARPWDLSLAKAWARALAGAGKHVEAGAAYADLVKRQPYDSELAIAYADTLLRARKPEAAYQVVLKAAERRMDDKLVVALMATAAQAGRFAEAAEIMQQIADRTGDPKAAALAEQLRAKAR